MAMSIQTVDQRCQGKRMVVPLTNFYPKTEFDFLTQFVDSIPACKVYSDLLLCVCRQYSCV